METQSYWCVEKVLSCDRWCVILFRQTKSPFSAFSNRILMSLMELMLSKIDLYFSKM